VYNLVRRTAKGAAANQQWLIVAPVNHCSYTRSTERTIVGDLDVGDARLPWDDMMYAFFDLTLKGKKNPVMDTLPRVRYYTTGNNKWNSSDAWPPKGAGPVTYYLTSGGKANTLNGDGALELTVPATDAQDRFTYDPMNPVPTKGGYGSTANGPAGAFDQRQIEARPDVLVYTTPPFTEAMQASGPVTPTLYVTSDAKDTDISVKILDVYPDGRAFNLDESIQRLRYRNGYDKPKVWMQPGVVAKVTLQPLIMSNVFLPGHRFRIEVSSSSFPHFDRNLNTGGHNYDETQGVVAHNAVRHSAQYPSSVTLTVVPASMATTERRAHQ
jgi:putative CocE/NonD family hydrolase